MARRYQSLDVDSAAWRLWDDFHGENPRAGSREAIKWAKEKVKDEELQKDFLRVVSHRESQAAHLASDVERIWPSDKGY